MARVGGWVTYMWAKIVRAVGDVGVPAFRLDATMAGVCPGEGGVAHTRAFLGNWVTWHSRIWVSAWPGWETSNFNVGSYPKISISILAAHPRRWCRTPKIIDFDAKRRVLAKFSLHFFDAAL